MSAYIKNALRKCPISGLGSIALLIVGLTGCGSPCRFSNEVTPVLEDSGATVTLHSVVALDNGGAIAVGDGGALLVSRLNEPWVTRSSGADRTLLAVAAGNKYIVAVGAMGTIVRSDDYGERWQPATSGVVSDLYSIAFHPFASSVVVVGDRVVLSSADNGQTWIRSEIPPAVGVLRAVGTRTRSGTSDFLAVGTAGTVILSKDMGHTWQQVDAGTSEDLYAVGLDKSPLLDKERFVIAGGHGTTRAMVDEDGREWVQFNVATNGDIIDISINSQWFLAQGGVVVTEGFVLQLGDDPGASLISIDGNIYEEAWAVGEAGTITHLTLSRELCLNQHY